VVDERAPYSGGVIGAFGRQAANDVLGDADAILAIGTKLGTMDTIDEHAALIDPSRQLVVQVDVDPLMVGWTTPVARAVLADAGRFLEQLVKLQGGAPLDRASGVKARVTSVARDVLDNPASTSEEVPFTPQRVISVLNQLVPDDAIVTADAGENRLFMMRWYASKRPGGYLQPAAGGGMGHAVPAALGAKLAFPEAPAVAVCGDGGFAMSMHGLMTAVEEQLPIGVVVFNNGVLGWVLHGMGKQVVAAHLSSFDHAAIARALGCDGVRVESVAELEEACGRLRSLERPLVIDVPMGIESSFRDVLDPIDQRRGDTGY
jgi:acetolactate synthase-1/2/3 large subunit